MSMEKSKTQRKCPKCKSRFGVFVSKNTDPNKSRVICFNGYCDFSMNINVWNDKYLHSQLNGSPYA